MATVQVVDPNGNAFGTAGFNPGAGGSAATVANDGAVTVTTSSTQLLPPNANRASGWIKHLSGATVYLKQGATATTAHLPFNPGDSFKVTHQQAVNAITASGSATIWAEEENR